MTVEVLIWSLDQPKLARCTICGVEWKRPRGRPGRITLELFATHHDRLHAPARLFNPDRPS